MMRALILILAAGLAGCEAAGDSTNDASQANNAGPAAVNGTDYVAQIGNMTEPVRRATFLRAIRDAGQACQEVVDAKPADAVDGNASWGVRCEDRRGWLISIARDGNAKVTGPVDRK